MQYGGCPAMAALFPPWTNTATYLALIGLGAAAITLICAPMIYARSPYATGQADPIVQPIPFDHRHHVRDDGIACLYCHENAERSPYAGIPPTERCLGCHAQIWNDSDLVAQLVDSITTGRPIRWQRVHSLPDFVYFDHAAHVGNGIDCARCHGEVDGMAAVYQVGRLSMQWCLDCHRDPPRGLRSLTHCSTCHR
jgi:hypothetical protein